MSIARLATKSTLTFYTKRDFPVPAYNPWRPHFSRSTSPTPSEQEPCPKTLPPNHNPLTQEQPADTLDNVHAALRLLIRLLSETERMELNYTERETAACCV
jgi:hypothetical protein